MCLDRIASDEEWIPCRRGTYWSQYISKTLMAEYIVANVQAFSILTVVLSNVKLCRMESVVSRVETPAALLWLVDRSICSLSRLYHLQK
jgi:hypothetical protein